MLQILIQLNRFHFENAFLSLFNISSLFFGGVIISSTFLEFSSGFTILLSFDLVTASAISFPKNSPALWITFLEQFLNNLAVYPIIVFYIFLQMIKIHGLTYFVVLGSIEYHRIAKLEVRVISIY